ncbi:MAG: hypothetical protein K1X28_08400 [Parachlamydiales bacterium]|nr:hypothetical protein [Parachlamydiales bacterium]
MNSVVPGYLRQLKDFLIEQGLRKYEKIPAGQLYKLFIDAGRWQKAENGLKERVFDEREPGYMESMVKAFMFGMEHREKIRKGGLTADFIERLHDIAVDKVVDESGQPLVKGFRVKKNQGDSERFGLRLGDTLTEEGYRELLQKRKNLRYVVEFAADESTHANLFETFMLNPKHTIPYWRNPLPSRKSTTSPVSLNSLASSMSAAPSVTSSSSSSSIKIGPYLDEPDDALASFLQACGINSEIEHPIASSPSTESLSEVNSGNESPTGEYNVSRIPLKREKSAPAVAIILKEPKQNEFLRKAVDHLANLYNKGDRSAPNKELRERILLVQDLDQLHPHYDANIRSFAILLPHILADDDETPPCFDDPNCFDCLSVDQLREKYLVGQKNFESLKQQ